jgi:hypothetical protein
MTVEFKRYEIATLPSSGLRAGPSTTLRTCLSVARNDNLAAGGAAALGDGPVDNHRSLLGARKIAFIAAQIRTLPALANVEEKTLPSSESAGV